MKSAPEKITATLWDCGGVFLSNGWDHEERHQVLNHFGLDIDEFEQRHPHANDQWERGKITLHEYLKRTVFYTPRSFSESDFIARMKAASRVLHPEMMEFLRGLEKRRGSVDGLGVYLASNESRELIDYRISEFGFCRWFDAFLVSCFLGKRKPEAAFFRSVLNIIQRRPAECVFIDDREENVAAARRLGIRGIRLDTPAQAIADLARLGVAVPAAE